MTEEWREAPGYPSYEVSSHGNVRRSTPYFVSMGRKNLKSCPGTGGYLFVSLSEENTKTTVRIHHLVCMAFNGPRPSPSHDAAHGNGINTDNRSDNLSWKTKVENQADRKPHGTYLCGEMVNFAKLTEAQVSIVKAKLKKGWSWKTLAEQLDVHPTTIYCIKRGKTWKHVQPSTTETDK